MSTASPSFVKATCRVALVVGNSRYAAVGDPQNPQHDAGRRAGGALGPQKQVAVLDVGRAQLTGALRALGG